MYSFFYYSKTIEQESEIPLDFVVYNVKILT